MFDYMEAIAYLGSIIIFISFCTKNVKLLRILNNVGCAIFIVYAVHHGRIPLIVLNSMVMAVNIYHLWKEAKDDNN